MGKNSDSIFQLSLTEIAFTLIFMLLMILGWMYFDAQKQRLAAESVPNTHPSTSLAMSADAFASRA